ncbi:MAG: CpcT/CpeT family chromophore lyase [Planctomycetota bacterium]
MRKLTPLLVVLMLGLPACGPITLPAAWFSGEPAGPSAKPGDIGLTNVTPNTAARDGKPEAMPEARPAARPAAKPEARPEPRAEPKPEPRPAPAARVEPQPEPAPEVRPAPSGKSDAELRAEELDRATSWMIGSFSSQAQAARDKSFFDIRMHTARIWPQRTDGVWIYEEQATAAALARPYRQRVYKMSVMADGKIKSDVYTLPGDPLVFAGAWSDVSKLNAIDPSSLALKDGCGLILSRVNDEYVGRTIGDNCSSDLRGATYSTTEVTLNAKGVQTWDRGYDKAGKLAWGPREGPYDFKRIQD